MKEFNIKSIIELMDNTYLQNVNTGVSQPPTYFGATTGAGMQYSKDANQGPQLNKSMSQQNPNSPSNIQANMTLPQSNYMNPKRVL